tara:strand:- start:44989 stop:45447 length:459 start_codon:yes stop_codon:yes gene_type:complete
MKNFFILICLSVSCSSVFSQNYWNSSAARAVYGSVTGERIKTQPEAIPTPIFAQAKKGQNKGSGFALIEETIGLFPNPASRNVTLNIYDGELSTVSIINVQGQVVYQQKMDEDKHLQSLNISVKEWPKGMCLLSATSNTGKTFYKNFVVHAQ